MKASLKGGVKADEQTRTAKNIKANLWNSTIKKQDLDIYGWDANPWVWVVEFERIGVE